MTGFLSDSDLEKTEQELIKQDFYSTFLHLNCHNGLRRGELHLIIGPQGGSKSTLIKSWILDLVNQKKKVKIHCSEENWDKYVVGINKIIRKSKNEEAKESLDFLTGYSELKLDKEFKKNFWPNLKEKLIEDESEVFILDNFTTSFLGMGSISEQGQNAVYLKKIADDLKIPVVVLGHTTKTANAETMVLRGEDIRGNASISNIASYVYLIQVLFHLTPTKSYLRVDKARYHQKANKKYFELIFNEKYGVYTGDRVGSLEALKNEINPKSKRIKL